MATTDTDLYRSVMGGDFKSIKLGIYPGDGVLDPRWVDKQYYSNKHKKMMVSLADITVVTDKGFAEVLPDGGTSLHDVSGWFPTKEFFMPQGTIYAAELIRIRKDKKIKTCPSNGNLHGFHYQLEPVNRMTQEAFKGALDNMARAAVVKQCEMVK